MQRIEELLKKFTPEDAEPVAQCIYAPLHQKVVKGMTKENRNDLQTRLVKLDAIFADVFQKVQQFILLQEVQYFALSQKVQDFRHRGRVAPMRFRIKKNKA